MSVVMVIGGAVGAAHVAEAIAYRETAAVRRRVEDLVARRRLPSAVHAALRRPRDLPFGVLALTRTWLEVLLLLIFGWVLPRLLLYPWLAWLSQLLEHTWYSPMPDARRWSREFHAGRAAHYGWATRLLLRALVLPAGDSYHLAHSLFPTLRWNYLPIADRLLARHDARYAREASQGFFFRRAGQQQPTACDWLVSAARRRGRRTDASGNCR